MSYNFIGKSQPTLVTQHISNVAVRLTLEWSCEWMYQDPFYSNMMLSTLRTDGWDFAFGTAWHLATCWTKM